MYVCKFGNNYDLKDMKIHLFILQALGFTERITWHKRMLCVMRVTGSTHSMHSSFWIYLLTHMNVAQLRGSLYRCFCLELHNFRAKIFSSSLGSTVATHSYLHLSWQRYNSIWTMKTEGNFLDWCFRSFIYRIIY